MTFNYGKILPGMIVGTTDTFTFFGAVTRATEAGITNTMNPGVSSHVFIIVKEHDLLYGIEMAWPKIRQCDLNEYEHGKNGNHAVFVANPFGPDYWEKYDLQEQVNEWVLKCHTIGIKYDVKELFKFWGVPVHDDKGKLICSDLARNMLKKFNVAYPKNWDYECSPYDIQKCMTSNGCLIDGALNG